MKIAFLCSSLEPGRDGVGDYTSRLAGELIRQGHQVIAVGLNERNISQTKFEQQEIDGVSVPVLRLPGDIPWIHRMVETHKWTGDFDPNWLSLQFVPFGFHPKGLCFGLGKRLANIDPVKPWHIMFHELWLGLNEGASVKHRIWGALQRKSVLDLIGHLRPQIVHTHAEPYRKVLDNEGVNASVLPLFGNLPRVNADCRNDLLRMLPAQASDGPNDPSDLYLAGVFGAVHPEWDAEKAVDTMLPLLQRCQKRLLMVFFGKSNLSAVTFEKLKFTLGDRAGVVMAGERTSIEVSKILNSLDLGLATSPRQIIQKSASVADMLEHGLSVLVIRDDWRLRGTQAPLEDKLSAMLSPEQFARLETLPTRNTQELNGVKAVASKLVEELVLKS
jgi:hypothetical protein